MRLFLLLILFMSAPAFAECTAQSGEQTIPLLELYTSEGCSSCPPADAWMSGLKGMGKVMPLAFHVDYWDYIGWKDRFANPKFSARQRQAAYLNGSTFVYTPQVMLNGRDYRGWRNTNSLEKVLASQSQPASVKLGLQMTRLSAENLQLAASAQAGRSIGNTNIYIAIYENNLSSRINAGENSGRELKHDFVVREWFGPYRFQNADSWQRTIPLSGDWKNREAGAVMFIQNRRNGEVLQTLALDFCR
jgi:hypothetical protein